MITDSAQTETFLLCHILVYAPVGLFTNCAFQLSLCVTYNFTPLNIIIVFSIIICFPLFIFRLRGANFNCV